jgi:putative phosphotransacetylase
MEILIEISARHIHLTKDDFTILFGDKTPTEIKELSQKDISCEETLEIVGKKSSISNVRLLTPFRSQSQLEISRTDCYSLGIDAPLKVSGDSPGANIKIIGPSGIIEKEIAIVAKRHLHLPPGKAEQLELKNGDVISVKISGDRELIFSNIAVRIKDIYSPAIHLDTDEANAAGISEATKGELLLNT